MKKTIFTMMLAAALTGGQAFADSAYTVVKEDLGYDALFLIARTYKYTSELGDIDGMSLTIRAPEQAEIGRDLSEYKVIVAYRQTIDPNLGLKTGKVTNNSLVMKGGAVNRLWGAATYVRVSVADGNSVVMTGGTVFDSVVSGYSEYSRASQNAVYLVGKGGKATIRGVEYTGSDAGIQIKGEVQVGAGASSTSNALDIYGTDISIGSINTAYTQILNFHIAEAQLSLGSTPMITLAKELDLTNFLIPTDEAPSPGLALSFDAMDNMKWKPGASVTLVSDALGIKIDDSLLNKEYNIYQNGKPDTVVATAKLVLEQGQDTTQFLKLVVPGNVPEPTTGTLSLLALAGLCARRRKKQGYKRL